MAAAGHGRILGVTSGSGGAPPTPGHTAARSAPSPPHLAARAGGPDWGHGQRAVADRRHPDGDSGRSRARRAPAAGPGATRPTGGLSLSLDDVPPPEHLGPIGAYLASDDFAWVQRPGDLLERLGGRRVMVAAPASRGGAHHRHRSRCPRLLEVLGPTVLGPPRRRRRATAAGNPRLAHRVRRARPTRRPPRDGARTCRRRDRRPASGAAIATRSRRRGVECVDRRRDAATDFAAAAEQLAAVAASRGRSTRWSWRSAATHPPARAPATPRRGSACSTSTPGSPTGSPPTRPGCGPSPICAGDASGRSGRHRRRRDDGRGSQSGPSRRAALPCRAPATADRVDAFAISVESAHASALGRPRSSPPTW